MEASATTREPRLSVVVPFYNEEQNVARVYAALVQTLEESAIIFELVFVDDGSSDTTYGIALALAQQDPRLRIVKFRRNFGQTPAMAAGIEHARGDIVITMDGDLQNDPRDIAHFLDKIAEGYDIVVGWRHRRQDKLVTRKIPSVIANWLIGKVTGVPIRDNGCSLKAFRASLIKEIPLYSDMHRFIPAMASVAGAKIAEIKVQHHARSFGQSKYGLSRIYKVLLDLLVIKTVAGFAARPALWFTLLALPLAVAGLSLTGYALWVRFAEQVSLSLPLAGSGVIFLTSAVILWSGGILGELVFRTGDMREHAFARLTQNLSARIERDD